jgi:squalene-hopene/tetraprenyl-beta-curcumene cyclase
MVMLELVTTPLDDDQASKEHDLDGVGGVIDEVRKWLAEQQAEDGHWAFELEADATIPSEYIMLNHYLGDIDDDVESKLVAYLKETQGKHGGWPLYHDGDLP